jgi:predicted amidohydrolase
MIWGQGDGSGLCAVDSRVGRIGQLACWEHYNPLARYALMADGEQIHSAMYPGSIFGHLFSEQTEVNVRQHALESACFVVCATAWLDADQQAQIARIPVAALARSLVVALRRSWRPMERYSVKPSAPAKGSSSPISTSRASTSASS